MMNDAVPTKSPSKRAHWAAVAVLALAALCPQLALAQMPGRFYWKPLVGANAVPVIFNQISGNTNPFDPSMMVMPDANLNTNMAMVGYASVFELADRAAMAAVILQMGNISGGVGGKTETSRGFGDPLLEFTYNVIGPKAQRNIPDVQRYQPGFSLDLLVDLAIPIGEYDSKQSVNLGMNRWYTRIGAPIVWQLGDWVPSRRTTLEFLPMFWVFGDNDDFTGKTLKSDPMFQIDAHLTRDFTKDLWGGLDLTWYKGGGSTVNGVAGGKLNNVGVGLTLGYAINDNLGLTFGYKSTINDSKPTDVRMDSFLVSLVFGWHPLVEGMKRLRSE
jgi:hypothetical protein